MYKTHRQHAGELRVQALRHAPAEQSAAIVHAIQDEMSPQHVAYYRRLRFLPLGVTRSDGRPWVTVLCNPEIAAAGRERLTVRARVNLADPFVAAVRSPVAGPRAFAGVAMDLANRSRVKLAGTVDDAGLDASGMLRLDLDTNEHMGNCPKYITVRDLRPYERSPATVALGGALSAAARETLRQASTSFIATRHDDRDPREADMGLNHRGGPKGFLRYFEDQRGAYLVLPDYSGNRFYQSLGNVETDPVMGIAIPDFATGALLQISGRAHNLFDDAAARIMPGASLVTLISIDEAYHTTGALDLRLVGDEQLSPYNPKLRLLADEQPATLQPVAMTARLVDIVAETSAISTFTFALPSPVEVVPGGYAILDFSDRIARGYQHMNGLDPQSLNDDYVRTFTVSKLSDDHCQLSITVKKSGTISSYLHSLAQRRGPPVAVELKGVGGAFTCFDGGDVVRPMLWVAGGVGITPFLAMYRALRRRDQIELLYACRGDEVDLIAEMTDIPTQIFDSTLASAPPATAMREVHARRLRADDFTADRLAHATVFLCGPSGFMTDVKSWLAHLEPSRLRFESFAY